MPPPSTKKPTTMFFPPNQQNQKRHRIGFVWSHCQSNKKGTTDGCFMGSIVKAVTSLSRRTLKRVGWALVCWAARDPTKTETTDGMFYGSPRIHRIHLAPKTFPRLRIPGVGASGGRLARFAGGGWPASLCFWSQRSRGAETFFGLGGLGFPLRGENQVVKSGILGEVWGRWFHPTGPPPKPGGFQTTVSFRTENPGLGEGRTKWKTDRRVGRSSKFGHPSFCVLCLGGGNRHRLAGVKLF